MFAILGSCLIRWRVIVSCFTLLHANSDSAEDGGAQCKGVGSGGTLRLGFIRLYRVNNTPACYQYARYVIVLPIKFLATISSDTAID